MPITVQVVQGNDIVAQHELDVADCLSIFSSPAQWFWFIEEGDEIYFLKSDGTWETKIVQKNETWGNEFIDSDWQREMAMEAGMLHGADAYNEMMGY